MRLCTEADRAAILAYIAAEPEMNLFLYGDIEAIGVDKDPVQIWAEDGPAGIAGVLLRYYDSYIFYSRDDAVDLTPFVALLRDRKIDNLSAKDALARRLAPFFPQLVPEPTHMSRCSALAPGLPAAPAGLTIRRIAGEAALREILELLRGIEEFAASYHGDEKELDRLRRCEDLGGALYGGYVDGRLVATAQTTAASSQSAMIVSVATRPDARGRGYASAVVAALCRDQFAAGRQFLCLFYDNPAAGRIYRRLGFAEVGVYTMLQPRKPGSESA